MPENDARIPEDLALWELHAYCLGAVQPPAPAVRRDANGRLLYAARDGLIASSMADGRRVSELESLGLIERNGERIFTTFPIIAPEASAPLRRRARALAIKCLPRVAAPAARIREILTAGGLSGHAHAVIFGHALDGLMWTILAGHGAVPDTRPTAIRPLWNGTFWAIWPPRPDPPGVNELTFPGMTLVMVWTPATEARLKELARRSGLEDALRAARNGSPASAVPGAPEWPFTDAEGRPLFPVIRTGDRLHLQSLAIAQPIADALTSEPPPRIEGVDDPRDARVIFGHELIWEISNLMRAADHIAHPTTDDLVSKIFLRLEDV